jgi:hypothetical protein
MLVKAAQPSCICKADSMSCRKTLAATNPHYEDSHAHVLSLCMGVYPVNAGGGKGMWLRCAQTSQVGMNGCQRGGQQRLHDMRSGQK